jgi:hypothetical protein
MSQTHDERRPGATVGTHGGYVSLSVQGISDQEGHAKIVVSPAEARRIALRLLEVADEQERQLARIREIQSALETLKRRNARA